MNESVEWLKQFNTPVTGKENQMDKNEVKAELVKSYGFSVPMAEFIIDEFITNELMDVLWKDNRTVARGIVSKSSQGYARALSWAWLHHPLDHS